jgi:splicing factor 3A subunit 3
METILEIQRRCHEERERLVKAMVDEFMTKKPPGKEQIYSDHRVKMYLNVSFLFLLFCLGNRLFGV